MTQEGRGGDRYVSASGCISPNFYFGKLCDSYESAYALITKQKPRSWVHDTHFKRVEVDIQTYKMYVSICLSVCRM